MITPVLHLHVCATLVSTYPALSESTLQFWQLGCGTPGLSDQAFFCDRRAAEVQHHLDGLTLLHAHLPLRQDGHRSHQQLLQVGLGLRKHLRQREVKVFFLKRHVSESLNCAKPHGGFASTRTDLISSILL